MEEPAPLRSFVKDLWSPPSKSLPAVPRLRSVQGFHRQQGFFSLGYVDAASKIYPLKPPRSLVLVISPPSCSLFFP